MKVKMVKILKFIELCIKFPIGLVAYLISPSFRAIVQRKLRGISDTVSSGETVVAVISKQHEV